MRVRKKRLLATCFTALLSVSIIMERTMFTSTAREEGSRTAPYYKSVRIQEGDSLWGITRQYREGSSMSMDEHMNQPRQMNGPKKGTIHIGQYLTVIYSE